MNFDRNDAIGLIGLVMLGAGLAMYDVRLALVIVGGLLLLAAVYGAIRSG